VKGEIGNPKHEIRNKPKAQPGKLETGKRRFELSWGLELVSEFVVRISDFDPLRRVISPAAERVTPGDALGRLPRAAGGAVLVHGVDRVLAARRVEAAVPAQQAAERRAVEQDEMDEQLAHDPYRLTIARRE
jgi:hypothetical protein